MAGVLLPFDRQWLVNHLEQLLDEQRNVLAQLRLTIDDLDVNLELISESLNVSVAIIQKLNQRIILLSNR